MTIANSDHAALRGVETALVELAGRTTQVRIAEVVGLTGSTQVSRLEARILDGETSWVEALRARALILLARSDEALRKALVEALCPPAVAADGSLVTADIHELMVASGLAVAVEADAVRDGKTSRAELRRIIAALDKQDAASARTRRDVLARQAALDRKGADE